jgi:hypothetical protein
VWISAAAPNSCREIPRHACRSAGFTPNITHTYGDLRAAVVLVATGVAVTLRSSDRAHGFRAVAERRLRNG